MSDSTKPPELVNPVEKSAGIPRTTDDKQTSASLTSDQMPLPASQPAPEPSPRPHATASVEEDSILARCHPHLLPANVSVPQINVNGAPDPTIGHLKLHFWVNGVGLVTRESVSGSSFSTPQEQQAELAFTKALTFSVPQTTECHLREIELIGDFYETKGSTGKWGTVVRLYPKFSFGPDGALVVRD